MKKWLVFCLFSFISFNSFSSESLEVCSERSLKFLNESLEDWLAEEDQEFVDFLYMKNEKNEILGYYVWGINFSAIAETCEQFDEDGITAANTWHYWDDENYKTKSAPSTWELGKEYFISDDEGFLYLTALEKNSNEDFKVKLTVKGWDDEGDEVTRKEAVVFLKK